MDARDKYPADLEMEERQLAVWTTATGFIYILIHLFLV